MFIVETRSPKMCILLIQVIYIYTYFIHNIRFTKLLRYTYVTITHHPFAVEISIREDPVEFMRS